MAEEQIPELTARLQGWLDHVCACEAGGQTMAEYAKAHGLALKAFYNGRTHLIRRGVLKSKTQGAVFRRVGVVSRISGALTCRMHFPNGLMVELGVDELRLGRVLQIAKGL